jgi:hypothetical protein
MARTFIQSFVEAIALDEQDGTDQHSDGVLFRMLDQIGRRARDEMSKSAVSATHPEPKDRRPKKLPPRLLIKARLAASSPFVISRPVEAAPSIKKPIQVAWTKVEVASALQDGVLSGRISGTAAMAALNVIARIR